MRESFVHGNDFIRYARSRLLTPAFLVVCGICAFLTLAFKGDTPAWRALLIIGPYLLALVGLRIWDDLADLPLDRQRHPSRVLCRSGNLPLFRTLAAAAVASPLLLSWQSSGAGVAYLLYCVVLAATYASTQARAALSAGASLQRKARVAVVLLKYPVVCASALLALRQLVHDFAVIQALLLLYAAAVAHEVVSHRGCGDSTSTRG